MLPLLYLHEKKTIETNSYPVCDSREAAMRAVFRDFDKDGSGKIDAQELKAVFAEMGKTYSDAEMERMIQIADKDASGTLEYEEFIKHCFGR